MKRLADPLLWLIVLFLTLLVGSSYSQALLSALFLALPRPVHQQKSFTVPTLSHFGLVGTPSLIAVLISTGAGIAVTRPQGAESRSVVETIAAAGQTFPPVAVLAIAVPVTGSGSKPAITVLILYGVLPILRAMLAGLGGISPSVMDIASGMGMSQGQWLRKVELPPTAPAILAGIRTPMIINIGTATIVSTVGANTLSTPIIIGLSGFNIAYVIQGALLVALVVVIVDRGFKKLARHLTRHVK